MKNAFGIPYNALGTLVVTSKDVSNPYQVEALIGKKRAEILELFFRRKPIPEFRIWLAPPEGAAVQVTTPEQANVNPCVINYYWNLGY
jgi:hypothetical protein